MSDSTSITFANLSICLPVEGAYPGRLSYGTTRRRGARGSISMSPLNDDPFLCHPS